MLNKLNSQIKFELLRQHLDEYLNIESYVKQARIKPDQHITKLTLNTEIL
jgi:hypothetical protein